MKNYIIQSMLMFLSIAVQAQQSPHGPIDIACIDCHTTDSWTTMRFPLKFDHSQTSFILRGEHRTVGCNACHGTLRFKETTADCIGCHRKQYEGAALIDHQKAGFSTDCLLCHTNEAQSWNENFDHNRTQFPTRGAHDAVACSQCHMQNKYRGTPIQCISCHQKEYDEARVPDHRVVRFSVECATCHRALTWQPAVFFPHESYFPIAAGDKHSPGVWNTCGDCHVNQSVYAAFECINCHRHSKARMDSAHEGRRGYEYLSSACYRCHPRGET